MKNTVVIVVLNDYSLSSALDLSKQGVYPAHHTWGVSNFQQHDIEVNQMPFFERALTFIRPLGIRTLVRTLVTQLWLLIQQYRYEVVYSACQSETWLLARLHRFGLFRRPIIAIVHHPLTGRLRGGASFISGHSALLFLSKELLASTKTAYPDFSSKMMLLPWGVDLSFYDQNITLSNKYGESFFISAGKANRDHTALCLASTELDARVLIVCSDESRPSGPIPCNVEVIADATGHSMKYDELLGVYRSALAVVIPLKEVNALAGLTSLLDALACGKPVVMTRNPYIDIDIELNGFGIWVDAGDTFGLHNAMKALSADYQLVADMGRRAREYAEREYCYSQYSEKLSNLIRQVAEVGA